MLSGSTLILDDRQQGFCPDAGNDRRINLVSPLKQAKYSHFPSDAAPALALAGSAKIALVNLDFAIELIAWKLAVNELPQSHEKRMVVFAWTPTISAEARAVLPATKCLINLLC